MTNPANDPVPVEPPRPVGRRYVYALRQFDVVPLWTVRTPIVYRYMDQQYVDEFFDSGKLRLSSFAQFSQHKDEERLDKLEGHVITSGVTDDNKAVIVWGSTGNSAYVLSTLRTPDPELKQRLGGGGFRILDTQSFAACLAAHVPDFHHGSEGECVYGTAPAFMSRRLPGVNFDAMKTEQGVPMEAVFGTMHQVAAEDPVFFKDQKYRHQAEYRFAWWTTREVSGFLSVVAPEARAYCALLEDVPRAEGDR